MKKPLVIGNWKAYMTSEKSCVALVNAVLAARKKHTPTYGFAVPDVLLKPLQALKTKTLFGVQNIGVEEGGAYTGKNTPIVIASTKADFTILGHSEVRAEGETNEVINKKILACFKQNLPVILCVGETSRDKNGTYLTYLEEELTSCLQHIDTKDFHLLTVAYEPVWAVGKEIPATPEECFEGVIVIRRTLATLGGMVNAKKVCVLYGGTVTKENAERFISDGGADGLLVGRASTHAKDFIEILDALHG